MIDALVALFVPVTVAATVAMFVVRARPSWSSRRVTAFLLGIVAAAAVLRDRPLS